jgi:hypothetical protein
MMRISYVLIVVMVLLILGGTVFGENWQQIDGNSVMIDKDSIKPYQPKGLKEYKGLFKATAAIQGQRLHVVANCNAGLLTIQELNVTEEINSKAGLKDRQIWTAVCDNYLFGR